MWIFCLSSPPDLFFPICVRRICLLIWDRFCTQLFECLLVHVYLCVFLLETFIVTSPNHDRNGSVYKHHEIISYPLPFMLNICNFQVPNLMSIDAIEEANNVTESEFMADELHLWVNGIWCMTANETKKKKIMNQNICKYQVRWGCYDHLASVDNVRWPDNSLTHPWDMH